MEGFFKRHGKRISLRSARIYDTNRRNADNEEDLLAYFERAQAAIVLHSITPERLWNCDETGESELAMLHG